MTEVENDRKIIRRRPMRGLKADELAWAQLGDPDGLPLSELLAQAARTGAKKLFLCGSKALATREYFEEPIKAGWEFARPFIFGFRSPVYRAGESAFAFTGTEVSVKLVSESWLPGCEDMRVAIPAWNALKAEWAKETDIPLLSTPSKTGQALLWESLPKGVNFPALPDDLATLIRGISPQHRLERLSESEATHAYDGRWMYAGCCLVDRQPIGEARKTGGFIPYQPGWHHVKIRIPQTWAHIGLIPRPCEIGGERVWDYPNKPGEIVQAWVSEPELTLALSRGWEIIQHIDGYAFDKGKPLQTWARKLIDMRSRLQEVVDSYGATPDTRAVYRFAAAAPREILNHTIGSFHANTFEREGVVTKREWTELKERFGLGHKNLRIVERFRGGNLRVTYPAVHQDRLSIYMPHWSAQIWALERAWVAKHALMCDPASLVGIRGDCIYSVAELPFKDDGHLSQLRPKAVS